MSSTSHSHPSATHDSHEGHSHAAFYWRIFGILVILTIATVGASRVDFGVMNIVIAMVIASAKAGTVALIFMHLKYENPLTWIYAGIPLVLLALLIGMLFLDEPLRSVPSGIREHGKVGAVVFPGAPGTFTEEEAHH